MNNVALCYFLLLRHDILLSFDLLQLIHYIVNIYKGQHLFMADL